MGPNFFFPSKFNISRYNRAKDLIFSAKFEVLFTNSENNMVFHHISCHSGASKPESWQKKDFFQISLNKNVKVIYNVCKTNEK